MRHRITTPDLRLCSFDQINRFRGRPPFDFSCWLVDLESARNLEYAFIMSKDADARKHHGVLGTSMIVCALRNFCVGSEYWVWLLGFSIAKVSLFTCYQSSVSSVEMAQRTRVDTGGHHFTEAWRQPARFGFFLGSRCYTSQGLHHSIWDLCGIKDMSLRRSAVGIQALVVSVARRGIAQILSPSLVVVFALAVTQRQRASLTLRPIFRRRSGSDSLRGAVHRSGEFFHI